MIGASGPKAEAAVLVLRRLALAIKTSALYPEGHPGRAVAVDAVVRDLRKYTGAYGPFSLHVTKQTVSVDGTSIEGQGSLANLLYTRKISEVTIAAPADQSQIDAFLSVAAMERSQLEAAGGAEHLVKKRGARDIHVKELVLRVREDAEILDLGAFFSLLGQGRLSPEERDRVIDILRAGTDQVVKLLQNMYALAGEVLPGMGEEGHVQYVYEAIRNLDRIILNESSDRQQLLYQHLAEATCRLGAPIDRHLVPILLAGAKSDSGIQAVLNRLSSDQLARMILAGGSDAPSEDEVLSVLRGLALERAKAVGVLSTLDEQLPGPRQAGAALTARILPKLRFIPDVPDDVPAELAFDESAIAVSAEELAAYRQAAKGIDEADAAREGLRTLLDVLRNEVEPRELQDAADAVSGCLRGLVERREFALLRESLQIIQAPSFRGTPARDKVVERLLESTAGGPLVNRVLPLLSESKDAPAAQEIWACLGLLGRHTIRPLVGRLGDEQGLEMREFLSDVLVRLAPEHVDDLGAFVTDPRPELVRVIAHILGRLQRPEGIAHLAGLVRHPELGVRVEALNALARIKIDAAQAQICLFLEDPEPMVRTRALSSLDAQGMRLALPALTPLVEGPDLLNKRFVFRRAAVDAMARVRVREALPLLKKLAGAPFAFGRCRRELRELARHAVAAIEQGPHAGAPDGDLGNP